MDEGVALRGERSRGEGRGRAALVRVAVVVLIAGVALLVAWRFGWLDAQHVTGFARSLRRQRSLPVTVAIFVAVYAVAITFGVPATVFMIAAGALFGTLAAAPIVTAGTLLGAAGGYWLARLVGADRVHRAMRRTGRLEALTNMSDFPRVLRLRLIPVIPFAVISYAAGLCAAPFARYLAATALGALPTTVVYAYFASSLLEGLTGREQRHMWLNIIVASALLLVTSLTPALVRRLRR